MVSAERHSIDDRVSGSEGGECSNKFVDSQQRQIGMIVDWCCCNTFVLHSSGFVSYDALHLDC